MLEKDPQQGRPLMFAEHGHCDLIGGVVQRPGDEVGPLALVWLSPGMIDHIEIGSIDGSLLDVHPVAIEVMEEPSGFLLAAEAVPNAQ
jgi:hypothetical protein